MSKSCAENKSFAAGKGATGWANNAVDFTAGVASAWGTLKGWVDNAATYDGTTLLVVVRLVVWLNYKKKDHQPSTDTALRCNTYSINRPTVIRSYPDPNKTTGNRFSEEWNLLRLERPVASSPDSDPLDDEEDDDEEDDLRCRPAAVSSSFSLLDDEDLKTSSNFSGCFLESSAKN
uniref:Uncharacterized protein n=1 Tax=Romanomermis culicivorax TaxID=13658 RepID=A0A915LAI0_ROMCU